MSQLDQSRATRDEFYALLLPLTRHTEVMPHASYKPGCPDHHLRLSQMTEDWCSTCISLSRGKTLCVVLRSLHNRLVVANSADTIDSQAMPLTSVYP